MPTLPRLFVMTAHSVKTAIFSVVVVSTVVSSALFTHAALADSSTQISVVELSGMDRKHLDKQVDSIDDLARLELGTQIRSSKDDLALLQRIIFKGLIAKDDHLKLQALGAVLGNVLVTELGLEWKIYEDRRGRSRATCAPDTQQCLFPITMLSRRMAVGLLPNVQKIYDETEEMITPYLPNSPYDVTD